MKRAASAAAASRVPAAKRPKAGTGVLSNGKGFTRGHADPLRKGAESYEGKVVNPFPQAIIMKKAGGAESAAIPKRDAVSKVLLFADFPEFSPTLTPAEVVLLGSFGGTYFRDIHSEPADKEFCGEKVAAELPVDSWGWRTGVDIRKQLPKGVGETPGIGARPEKFDAATMIHSDTYQNAVNKFNVSCGGSLFMWESSGWINPIDPYGWFQWYCRFYLGRRTSDDKRQIQRWLNSAGPKGRFRNQLLNKCTQSGKAITDPSVSPVIRQTLQHWALEVK